MSFEWTRCAASTASGPRKSHLLSGETSHMPTPSRTAAYSASASPNETLQYQPPSSTNVAPRASWTAWNAVVIGSLTVRPPSAVERLPRAALRRYTPSLNRCSTRRGAAREPRTGRRPSGSGRSAAAPARTRNACAVTSASSSASCGLGDRDPQPAGRRRQPVAGLAARRRRRAVGLDRQVPDVDRPAAPRARAPAEDRRQEVHLHVGEPHQEVAAADRLAERALAPPRAAGRPPDPAGGARGSSATGATAGRRGSTSWCTRLGEHDPSAAHRHHAERHDRRRARSPGPSPRSRATTNSASRHDRRRTRRGGPATLIGRARHRTTSDSVTISVHPEIEVAARQSRSSTSWTSNPIPIRAASSPRPREEPVVEPAAVADAPSRPVERDAPA